MGRNGAYRDRSVLIHGKFKSEKWDFQDHIIPPVTTAVSFRLRSAERGAEGFQRFANPDVDRAKAHPIYIYDRLEEPCVGLLEETLAFAEKGETAWTSSAPRPASSTSSRRATRRWSWSTSRRSARRSPS
jgi:cystathionine gamma-lyase/methionine-gamma-lyase